LIKLAEYYDVTSDYILGRTDYNKSLTKLNVSIVDGITTGKLLSDVMSLSEKGKKSIFEYIDLIKLNEDNKNNK
jgi:hypothetical protein